MDRILGAAVGSLVALCAPAWADQADDLTCGLERSEPMAQLAMDSGIVSWAGIEDGDPTIRIARDLWEGASFEQRLGIAYNIGCTIAGDGKVIRRLVIKDQMGRVMSVWNGVKMQFQDD